MNIVRVPLDNNWTIIMEKEINHLWPLLPQYALQMSVSGENCCVDFILFLARSLPYKTHQKDVVLVHSRLFFKYHSRFSPRFKACVQETDDLT